MVSGDPFTLLAPVAFVVLMILLISVSIPIGGLLGLVFARIVAGRRRLKQVGYFLMTAFAVLFSILWYYAIYSDNTDSIIFEWLLSLAQQLGFTSEFTPGSLVSRVSLGLLVGAPLSVVEIVLLALLFCAAVVLNNINGTVCELAHYNGWLAVESVRGRKQPIREHTEWAPISIPLFRFNSTVTVSIWYNITNLRRETRVFSNYLLNPFRYVIFILIPLMGPSISQVMFFIPFALSTVLVLISTTYAIYFAGYETVYEGPNLMNLQLAAANMADYLKGKVYSAVPFSAIVAVGGSIVVLFFVPSLWTLLPIIIIWCTFTTMMAGGFAAKAAVTHGDFKSQRMILRQRGSPVQMPIRGWGSLKAQLLPMLIGTTAGMAMLLVGLFSNLLLAYTLLLIYALICLKMTNHYCYSAGVRLAQIECSEYL